MGIKSVIAEPSFFRTTNNLSTFNLAYFPFNLEKLSYDFALFFKSTPCFVFLLFKHLPNPKNSTNYKQQGNNDYNSPLKIGQ